MSAENIVATRDTWLKLEPSQAATLPDSAKRLQRKGDTFDVETYAPDRDGHWKVKIAGETYFIYDAATHGPASHWQCSWEQDSAKENDDEVSPALIARAVEAQSGPAPVGLRLKPSDSFDTLITPHFTYGEICKYSENRRLQHVWQCESAYYLLCFAEQARANFGGKRTIITSGHRPTAVNRAVGGATESEHLFRAPGFGAIDFAIEGVSPYDLEVYCDRNWDQSVGYGAAKGFSHLGSGRGRVRWNYG